MDLLVSRLAEAQHGVVTYRQLLALGLTRSAIARRARAGRLHRVHVGVYAVGHAGLGRLGRWMAAVLACGDGAVLSHRSAAALWGLRPTAATRVDVTVPVASGRRRPGIVVHRSPGLTEVTVHEGIPVTTPNRTLVDLADVLRPDALRRAVEQAEALRLLNVAELTPRRGRRPVPLDVEPAFTRSELERLVLALCDRHRLPRPLTNTLVEGFEVDFLWRDARLVAEADGRRHHGTAAAFERDRERDARLVAAGYRVVRFTYRHVVERPEHVVATLRAALGLT